jgi:hypothetical protein
MTFNDEEFVIVHNDRHSCQNRNVPVYTIFLFDKTTRKYLRL